MSDSTSKDAPSAEVVGQYLRDLQDAICEALESIDGTQAFSRQELANERGGLARPRILEEGAVIEKAAVNFSHSRGDSLPSAATERRPELLGASYESVSVSLIVHPRNPYAPTTHANFRFFRADPKDAAPVWWFGGGFDLTPYYGFDDDAHHWHQTAWEACRPFGEDLYPRFKEHCDKYFYLPHRKEPRGLGGLFFDDFNDGTAEHCESMFRSVADHFLKAYLPILERRKDTPFGDRERDFQLYRRGRYVEFNLLQDRGTRFGLEIGARTESILASLPPLVRWRYDWKPEAGSPEARLYEHFLKPRDWLS